jgi:hypothetical protein
MTDKYVIVYRDGCYGEEMTRAASNNLLKRSRMRAILETDRPAYRIRIREKAVASEDLIRSDRDAWPDRHP